MAKAVPSPGEGKTQKSKLGFASQPAPAQLSMLWLVHTGQCPPPVPTTASEQGHLPWVAPSGVSAQEEKIQLWIFHNYMDIIFPDPL